MTAKWREVGYDVRGRPQDDRWGVWAISAKTGKRHFEGVANGAAMRDRMVARLKAETTGKVRTV